MHWPPDGTLLSIWDSICGWTEQQANVVLLADAFLAFSAVAFVLIMHFDLALGMLSCCFRSGYNKAVKYEL